MKACPLCQLRYPEESVTCFVDGSTLGQIPDPRVGTVLAGRYELEGVLGEGGMATVYRARHRLRGSACAVKVLARELADNAVVRERFRREAKTGQKLAHPNIIEIFDQGETGDGSLYMVMELLEGCALSELLERERKLPIERALPLFIQIARALARAHDLEVIHRDLKPENIFITRERDGSEWVKLLDFGIARSMQDSRLTGTGEVFGTPQYMAPERITSTEAGAASDLYAVGVIMFELLTGQLPFDASDISGFFMKHLKEPPPSLRALEPSCPEVVEQLVFELLAKDPAARPVDAHRLHADLMKLAGAIGVRPPLEVTEAPPLEAEPIPSLPPVDLDHWSRRIALFRRMLERSSSGAPALPAQAEQLAKLERLLRESLDLRAASFALQHELEQRVSRGREGRQRFGHAVDALGLDVSRARDELKSALAAAALVAAEVERLREAARQVHREVIVWEGRSGFEEPWPELVAAYRAAADAVEVWLGARRRGQLAEGEVEAKRTEVQDLEYQVQQLREALAKHEENTDHACQQCQAQVTEASLRVQGLEAQLLEEASRFCAPLRQRPELVELFQQLEGGGTSRAAGAS